MHVLIINFSPIHTRFLTKAFRYENIGADSCRPENLLNMWYGQYEALIVPLQSWTKPPFIKIYTEILKLGEVPIIFTGKWLPPHNLKPLIKQHKHMRFIGSHNAFHQMVVALEYLVKEQAQRRGQIEIIEHGELRINLRTHQAERSKKILHLRNKEFSLLECLMKNPGEVLTRTFLLERVWDRNTSILSNTVDVHISRLRKKVDGNFKKPMIVTIPRVGYKLAE